MILIERNGKFCQTSMYLSQSANSRAVSYIKIKNTIVNDSNSIKASISSSDELYSLGRIRRQTTSLVNIIMRNKIGA